MSDGTWAGGIANRTWERRGGNRYYREDPAIGPRLYAQLAGEPFWCDTCGRSHPLREHRECRQPR